MKIRSSIIIFLHIPKAGGTTLCNWIFENVRTRGTESDRWVKNSVFYYPSGYVRGPYPDDLVAIERAVARPDLQAVLGHAYFGLHKRVRRPATYITVLRDPVERVVSLYHFQRLVEEKHGTHQGVKISPGMTLEEFAEAAPYIEINNGQTRRIAGFASNERPCPREALHLAKENIDRHFTVAGVLDKFEETLVMMKRAFGWNRVSAYYPQNLNPGRPPLSEVSKSALDAIMVNNELDRELYIYVRERFIDMVERAGEEFQRALRDFKSSQGVLQQGFERLCSADKENE